MWNAARKPTTNLCERETRTKEISNCGTKTFEKGTMRANKEGGLKQGKKKRQL